VGPLAEWFDAAFNEQLVMAILRGYPPDHTVQLSSRAWDLGLNLVEVPIQTPDAVASLRAAVAAGKKRGKPVGAGTVCTIEQVETAAQVGAAFTVAPGFDPQIVAASHDHGMPHLPGVAAPTDIQRALAAGVRWMKAFPASVLGVNWFRAMAGPFPNVPFVATGGMNADNAREYLAAGARAIAVGSALEDERQLVGLAGLVRGADPLPGTEAATDAGGQGK
jgi:2-dehydro-3-deoxyphosphogluconate aldolase / (4S)-4-hydroxy-2-oxoglutarate aldolase